MNPNCVHHEKYKPFGQMCKMRYLQFKLDENNAEINTEWITDLNLRPEAIKLLEENIGRTLFDINYSNIFF